VLAAQFGFDLVRELPQEGDGLAEIRQCTVNHAGFSINWLQVLGPAELAQIDQRVRHQLHPIVPLLDTFKS
jgi:hypothetical protein